MKLIPPGIPRRTGLSEEASGGALAWEARMRGLPVFTGVKSAGKEFSKGTKVEKSLIGDHEGGEGRGLARIASTNSKAGLVGSYGPPECRHPLAD